MSDGGRAFPPCEAGLKSGLSPSASSTNSGVDPAIKKLSFLLASTRMNLFPHMVIRLQALQLCHNPRPTIFCHWTLFPYSEQPLHILDIPSVAWPNTGGQSSHPAVASLAKDEDLPPTALPQPRAHLHLPQDCLHPPQQPLHSPDWEPPLSPVGVAPV